MTKRRRHHIVVRTTSNVLLTCEHAKGVIPREYGRLGLIRKQLHQAEGDWYDYGAFDLMKALSRYLKCSYLYTDISRLVIDHNRTLNAKTRITNSHHSPALKTELITEVDGKETVYPIPGNLRNSKQEEKKRFNKYVVPYQKTGESAVNRIGKKHKLVYMLAIHSLHPLYNGEKRDVNIDIMDHRDKQTKKACSLMVRHLRKLTKLKVLLNIPWGHDHIDGGGWKYVYNKKNIIHIGIDVNSNNLKSKNDIEKTAQCIAKSLEKVQAEI